jgi:hypothetical protein
MIHEAININFEIDLNLKWLRDASDYNDAEKMAHRTIDFEELDRMTHHLQGAARHLGAFQEALKPAKRKPFSYTWLEQRVISGAVVFTWSSQQLARVDRLTLPEVGVIEVRVGNRILYNEIPWNGEPWELRGVTVLPMEYFKLVFTPARHPCVVKPPRIDGVLGSEGE